MTEDNVRYHAQRALADLDYLDTHVIPRKGEYATAVANSIDDLRKHLCKLIGTPTTAP